jgi:hypothetical protein
MIIQMNFAPVFFLSPWMFNPLIDSVADKASGHDMTNSLRIIVTAIPTRLPRWGGSAY